MNQKTKINHSRMASIADSCTRKNLLLFMKCLLLSNLVLYGLFAVQALFSAVRPFYYNPLEGYAGFLYDFYNPMKYAYHLDLMEHMWSNAPPFLHFFCYLVSLVLRLFVPFTGGGQMSWSVPGQICFALLAAGMLSAIFGAVWRYTKPFLRGWERSVLCAALLSGYPFFFALACGNLVLLAAALMVLFLVVYESGRSFLAAVLLGAAAALKLYPALLGILFLCDKRWKEAFVCAATGIGLTLLPLFLFEGGFTANLQDWLQKAAQYNEFGNLNLRRTMMDSNSFLMLWDIPKYIASGAAVTLEEMAAHNMIAKQALTAMVGMTCLSCFLLRRRHDRALLMCLWMVCYPYNSGPYNLVLLAVGLVWWIIQEKDKATAMIILGAAALMCKTRFALYATTVRHITLQSALNPLLMLSMMALLFWMRRDELKNDGKQVRQILRRKIKGAAGRTFGC